MYVPGRGGNAAQAKAREEVKVATATSLSVSGRKGQENREDTRKEKKKVQMARKNEDGRIVLVDGLVRQWENLHGKEEPWR